MPSKIKKGKTAKIELRVTPGFKARAQAAADKRGMSMSELLEYLLRREIDNARRRKE